MSEPTAGDGGTPSPEPPSSPAAASAPEPESSIPVGPSGVSSPEGNETIPGPEAGPPTSPSTFGTSNGVAVPEGSSAPTPKPLPDLWNVYDAMDAATTMAELNRIYREATQLHPDVDRRSGADARMKGLNARRASNKLRLAGPEVMRDRASAKPSPTEPEAPAQRDVPDYSYFGAQRQSRPTGQPARGDTAASMAASATRRDAQEKALQLLRQLRNAGVDNATFRLELSGVDYVVEPIAPRAPYLTLWRVDRLSRQLVATESSIERGTTEPRTYTEFLADYGRLQHGVAEHVRTSRQAEGRQQQSPTGDFGLV